MMSEKKMTAEEYAEFLFKERDEHNKKGKGEDRKFYQDYKAEQWHWFGVSLKAIEKEIKDSKKPNALLVSALITNITRLLLETTRYEESTENLASALRFYELSKKTLLRTYEKDIDAYIRGQKIGLFSFAMIEIYGAGCNATFRLLSDGLKVKYSTIRKHYDNLEDREILENKEFHRFFVYHHLEYLFDILAEINTVPLLIGKNKQDNKAQNAFNELKQEIIKCLTNTGLSRMYCAPFTISPDVKEHEKRYAKMEEFLSSLQLKISPHLKEDGENSWMMKEFLPFFRLRNDS